MRSVEIPPASQAALRLGRKANRLAGLRDLLFLALCLSSRGRGAGQHPVEPGQARTGNPGAYCATRVMPRVTLY